MTFLLPFTMTKIGIDADEVRKHDFYITKTKEVCACGDVVNPQIT